MFRFNLGLHPVETWYVSTVPFMEQCGLYVFFGKLGEWILFESRLNVEEIDFFWHLIYFDVVEDAYVNVLLENR